MKVFSHVKVFSHEFLKIYSKRSFLAILAAVLMANLILLYTSQDSELIAPSSYKKLYADLMPMSEEEKVAFVETTYQNLSIIQDFEWFENIPEDDKYLEEIYEQYRQGDYLTYTRYLYTELALMKECYEDIQSVKNYAQYLQDIESKAGLSEDVSIFRSEDAYTQRNARKTAHDFVSLRGNQLKLTNSKSITAATNFVATDIAIILILFVLAGYLITTEKQKGLFALIRPTRHGKGRLIFAKISVMSLTTVIISIIFWASNIILCGVLYGFSDFGAPIQSVAGFIGSILPFSILRYLLLFVISKTVVYIILGLFFLWFAQTSRFAVLIYIKIIILFLLSLAVYLLTPAHSGLIMLRYINIIHFMLVTPIYKYYYNLNIFSFPVNMILIFVISSILLIAVLIWVNTLCFCENDVVEMERLPYFRRTRTKKRANVSVLHHELYKTLIANKALIVMILLLGFQVFSLINRTNPVVGDEYYYRQYMRALEGPQTEAKHELLSKEADRFLNIDTQIQTVNEKYAAGEISRLEYEQSLRYYSNEQITRQAFSMVLDRVQYMHDKREETGAEVWFVYEKGWDYLFGGAYTGAWLDMVNALAMVIAMIASYSAVFSNEFSSGMIRVISTCKGGRLETVKKKIRICLAWASVILIVSYLPDILFAWKYCGLHSISSPLASLPNMTAFPIFIPLWLYLAVLVITRFVVMTAVMFIILFVSTISRDTIKCIVILTAGIIVPLFLHLLGLEIVDYFSLNLFLASNMLLNNRIAAPGLNVLFILFSLLLPFLIILFASKSLKKRFAE